MTRRYRGKTAAVEDEPPLSKMTRGCRAKTAAVEQEPRLSRMKCGCRNQERRFGGERRADDCDCASVARKGRVFVVGGAPRRQKWLSRNQRPSPRFESSASRMRERGHRFQSARHRAKNAIHEQNDRLAIHRSRQSIPIAPFSAKKSGERSPSRRLRRKRAIRHLEGPCVASPVVSIRPLTARRPTPLCRSRRGSPVRRAACRRPRRRGATGSSRPRSARRTPCWP